MQVHLAKRVKVVEAASQSGPLGKDLTCGGAEEEGLRSQPWLLTLREAAIPSIPATGVHFSIGAHEEVTSANQAEQQHCMRLTCCSTALDTST
jgi:hypothetical protein